MGMHHVSLGVCYREKAFRDRPLAVGQVACVECLIAPFKQPVEVVRNGPSTSIRQWRYGGEQEIA